MLCMIHGSNKWGLIRSMDLLFLVMVAPTLALDGVTFENDGPATSRILIPHKRTREALLEIAKEDLPFVIERNEYTAVLYQNSSKRCLKGQHDLELIKADATLFGISWRTIREDPVGPACPKELAGGCATTGQLPDRSTLTGMSSRNGCRVELHFGGQAEAATPPGKPAVYPGRPDRQTAVLRWMITEIFCRNNRPLPVDSGQFQLLARTFSNFILVTTSETIKSSVGIVNRLAKVEGLCAKVGRTLMATTDDPHVLKDVLKLSRPPPNVVNIVLGSLVEYDGSLQDLAEILFWINVDTAVNVKVAGEANFDRIVAGSEEDLVLVLFVDESSPLLTRALRAVLSELEDIYGVTVIEVADLTVAGRFQIARMPAVVLFENGVPKKYAGKGLTELKAVADVRAWFEGLLEEKDRIVVKSISSEAFKHQPQDHKHVLFKEHKDSMQRLAFEYAKLIRENEKLKSIIKAGQEALAEVEIVVDVGGQAGPSQDVPEDPATGTGKAMLSSDCSDCLASVGMAAWNCGTFEMDCIKGAIELGSECYPCACEVLDTLWPDDAPNCFKKEIQRITKAKEVSSSGSTQ